MNLDDLKVNLKKMEPTIVEPWIIINWNLLFCDLLNFSLKFNIDLIICDIKTGWPNHL